MCKVISVQVPVLVALLDITYLKKIWVNMKKKY